MRQPELDPSRFASRGCRYCRGSGVIYESHGDSMSPPEPLLCDCCDPDGPVQHDVPAFMIGPMLDGQPLEMD